MSDVELRRENERLKARIAALDFEAQRLRATLSGVGDGVVATDVSGHILQMNGAAEFLSGWSEAEARGRLVSEVLKLVSAEPGPEVEDVVARVLRQGVMAGFDQHLVLVGTDGTRRAVRCSGTVVRYASGEPKGTLLVFHSADAQATSPSFFRPRPGPDDAFYRIDHLGMILEHNVGLNRLLGLPADQDLKGTTIPDIWEKPDDRLSYLAELTARGFVRNQLVNAKNVRDEKLIISLTAHLLNDEQGKPFAIEGVAVDFTSREPAQRALRDSDARVREAQRLAHLGNWELDLQTNKLIWSEEIFRIFEIDPALFAESYEAFLAAIHPEDRAAVAAAYAGSLETHTAYDVSHRLLMPDGRIKHVHERCVTTYSPEGKALRSLGTVQDVTERKLLEEQLRQSQKMEAIGSLAGGVAHDFNNLLSVILNGTDFVLDAVREGDPLREDLLEVKAAADRAVVLTRQLLAFSRRQVLQPRSLDLNQVVQGVDKMLRRLIGEDIDFVRVLAPDLGVVSADPGQVEQVLVNLVLNARDAMPRGGTLTIQTANGSIDEALAATLELQAGPGVVLSITDTGAGMDEATRLRIFEPFFTTKALGKGTGLGLSMVYGIVKQSGGSIRVSSEPGQGTTFTLFLPRKVAATAAVLPRPPDRERARGTETILAVEDEATLLEVTRRTLEASGYTVLTAGNGAEALEVAARHGGELHLLVTDVVMPRLGGKPLADQLLEQRPGLRVLYMSGYTDGAIENHGVLEADTHFLHKPFTAAGLTQRVREVLDAPVTSPR